MPLIQFDPPNTQQGGAPMNAETRKEFISLCRQIQERTADIEPIIERMLSIMRQDITNHIHTLSDEKEQMSLLDDVETFYSTIDPSEQNRIGVYNTICFQIVTMMFLYEHRNESFNDYKRLMYIIQIDREGNWKNNRLFYKRLSKNRFIAQVIENKYGDIYLGFPGFIRLGELNESFLNNVFYIGVNYETAMVDGQVMNPLVFFRHDINHVTLFREESRSFESELNMYKKLREFVMKHYPSHLYSIDLILFCIIHETSIHKYKEYTYNDSTYSVTYLIPYITDTFLLQGLSNMDEFGSAIPKAYRIPLENNSKHLDKNRVREYIELCAQRFSDALKEMRSSLEGGKRYRKTRKGARKQAGRKRTGRKRV